VTEQHTNDTAGAGSPAPAVSLVSPDAAGTGTDVVAPGARVELDRIRRRWAELPIDRAESRMPVLRRLLADLAPRSFPLIADHPPRTAAERPGEVGDPQSVVPDLGPAVVVDQLSVLVWDAYATGRGDGIPGLLTSARRELG
jgi:hypothetical protein